MDFGQALVKDLPDRPREPVNVLTRLYGPRALVNLRPPVTSGGFLDTGNVPEIIGAGKYGERQVQDSVWV